MTPVFYSSYLLRNREHLDGRIVLCTHKFILYGGVSLLSRLWKVNSGTGNDGRPGTEGVENGFPDVTKGAKDKTDLIRRGREILRPGKDVRLEWTRHSVTHPIAHCRTEHHGYGPGRKVEKTKSRHTSSRPMK